MSRQGRLPSAAALNNRILHRHGGSLDAFVLFKHNQT